MCVCVCVCVYVCVCVQFIVTPIIGKVLSLCVGLYEDGNKGALRGGGDEGLSTGLILLAMMPTRCLNPKP